MNAALYFTPQRAQVVIGTLDPWPVATFIGNLRRSVAEIGVRHSLRWDAAL